MRTFLKYLQPPSYVAKLSRLSGKIGAGKNRFRVKCRKFAHMSVTSAGRAKHYPSRKRKLYWRRQKAMSAAFRFVVLLMFCSAIGLTIDAGSVRPRRNLVNATTPSRVQDLNRLAPRQSNTSISSRSGGNRWRELHAANPAKATSGQSGTAAGHDEAAAGMTGSHQTKTFITWFGAHVQRFILGINCRTSRRYFTTEERCEAVKRSPLNLMRFYATPPKLNTVYSVAIPDGQLRDYGSHHSVAVVDPFPTASFGHLVMIFFVDGSTKPYCLRKHGLYIESGLCLTMARRARCRNQFRATLSQDQLAKKCEVNFIPTVYDSTQETAEHAREQTLKCIPYLAGFGPCPAELATKSVVEEKCELRHNSRRCYTKKQSIPGVRHRLPLCRLFSTCDYGVTVYGGWNNVTMLSRNEENLRKFYGMLKRNGFRKNNIQVFYNGNGNVPLGEPYTHGMPASNKNSIRNHITSLCQTALCVDSLVFYLNGPTMSDGSILLWDINGDGEAQSTETYSPDEFLDDVTACDANHVFIFADQSYAGMLRRKLRERSDADEYPGRTDTWNRVVLLSSGDEYDYSWGSGIIDHWSSLSTMFPVAWAFDNLGYLHSQASITQRRHAEDFTLYGAPIKMGLPVSAEEPAELKRNYMGCQDLPAAEWILQFSHNYDEQGFGER